MRIDAVDVYHLAVPLIEPWRTAYGEDATVETVLVEMHAGDVSGWGESCPLAAPCYSGEWAGGVFATVVRWMAPAVVGQTIESGAALQERLAAFKGNTFAKAALDTAWWVTHSLRRGEPLHRVLGAERDQVEVGADFGVMDSIDQLIGRIGQAIDDRFARVKLKFRPGWDLNMLRAVRGEFADHPIHIDCNAAFRYEDFDLLCRLDDFALQMIEQPLAHDDLIDHARLQSAIQTPVCLDESITSIERAAQALDLGSCRYVNIKPGRVGGLTPAVAIHDACRDVKIPCWVGGMLETAIGARICTALAMLPGCTYPADIFPSSRFYSEEVADRPVELCQSEAGRPAVAAAEVPGVGTTPIAELLDRFCVQRARIE